MSNPTALMIAIAAAAGEQPRAIVLRNLDESTVASNEANTAGEIVMIDCTVR